VVNSGSGVIGRTNRLLDAVPPAQVHRLMASFRPVFLDMGTVLFEPGQTIDFIDFPCNCVVSLVTPLKGGAVVEVATIGNEGIVGVPLAHGGSLAVRAISSLAGWADRVDSSIFLAEVERNGALRELVTDYLPALFGQISQAAACNRLHSTEARLSRWLLMTHDRVGTDEFAVTHEFLGQMLGSTRPTVTLSAQTLQTAGLISYHAGQVTIVDRAGLESVACECYGVIRAALDQVVQSARRRNGVTTPPAIDTL
jgi:CRP-like cAMP-binding protein